MTDAEARKILAQVEKLLRKAADTAVGSHEREVFRAKAKDLMDQVEAHERTVGHVTPGDRGGDLPDPVAVRRSFQDVANGQRLVRRHGEDLRFVSERKDRGWMTWDGSRWIPDAAGYVMEMAKDTAHAIYEEADAIVQAIPKDMDPIEKSLWYFLVYEVRQHALRSHGDARREALVKAARTDPAIRISAEVLDTHRWLLNCTNGTLDMRTGKLQSAERSDYITKTTGIEYDPDAMCPTWERFMAWAMLDRPEVVAFLQRVFGIALTGRTSERMVLLFHGTGSNGKSVMLKTMRRIAKDYAERMDASTLEQAKYSKGGGTPRGDIARLKGARFVYTSEMEDGTKLAASLLKDMTSGDESMTARKLYENDVEFTPEFTPFIATNHLPDIDAFDNAVWNRLFYVPFHAVIAEADKNTSRGIAGKDGDLGELLLEEAPGILAWCVRGCLDLLAGGLRPPTEVTLATTEYRNEQNTFGDWLAVVAEDVAEADGVLNHGPNLAPTPLRDNYNRWAKLNLDDFEKPMTQREFKRYMLASGCRQTEDSKRTWVLPVRKVTRFDFGELARLAATHVPTAEELADYEAEVRVIDDEEHEEAVRCGFETAHEMNLHDALERDQEAV